MQTSAEIAAAVKAGTKTARQVTEEVLATIDAKEGDVHAFNYVMRTEALVRADEIDAMVGPGEDPGPLAGVPVAVKDNLTTKGVPTTCSSKILDGWVPPYNATVIDAMHNAGAVIVGKTNLDEFAMGGSTENSAFGVTKNPHDLNKVAGGSSGGSAAAVAAGFAPLSVGSDTGGSIRQPASFCGVVGIKPTYGLVSRYGLVAFASSLDQVGPFAANVADAAALLQVLVGYDKMDSTSIDRAVPDYSATLGQGVEGLRVGIITEMMGEGISPDVAERVRKAAEVLEAQGAKVGEATVPASKYALSAYYLIAPAEASSNLARYDGVRYGNRVNGDTLTEMNDATRAAGFGPEVKRRIMLGTYALSAGYYDAYYGKAQKIRTLITRDFDEAYQQYDILLSPTAPTTAFDIGERTNDPFSMYLADVCTIPTNLAGHPAMSVPFGQSSQGLPIGVQLLGPALSEPTLLRAASVLEANA